MALHATHSRRGRHAGMQGELVRRARRGARTCILTYTADDIIDESAATAAIAPESRPATRDDRGADEAGTTQRGASQVRPRP